MVHSYEGIQGRNPPRLYTMLNHLVPLQDISQSSSNRGSEISHFSNKIQVVLIGMNVTSR